MLEYTRIGSRTLKVKLLFQKSSQSVLPLTRSLFRSIQSFLEFINFGSMFVFLVIEPGRRFDPDRNSKHWLSSDDDKRIASI